MRGRGGGRLAYLDRPAEYRGTTRQVCGLWPYVTGAGAPLVGVPLGRHLVTGSTVCCDPIAWFERSRLIANPSMFTLAKPGLGKSSINRRMVLGLDYRGTVSLVPGDTKGEYTRLIRALGGEVIRLGRGQGSLNPLDLGQMGAAARRLAGAAREELLAEAVGRRASMVAALVAIVRRGPVGGDEEALLGRAVQLLADRDLGRPALLSDLVELVRQGPEPLLRMTLADDEAGYRQAVRPVLRSLQSLVEGPLGATFNRQTTQRLALDRPVSIDLSAIPASEKVLESAVLLTCWAEAFAAIEAHDRTAGTDPGGGGVGGGGGRRHFFVVLDELWRILRAGVGLVDRIDELTRLNRTIGIGQSMTTHSMADLLSLPSSEDREKARGFVERSGLVLCGGLPPAEMTALQQAVQLSERERQMVTQWSAPGSIDSGTGAEDAPPGRGRFLIKVAGHPGIPVRIDLTAEELPLNDTNERWAHRVVATPGPEQGAGAPGVPGGEETVVAPRRPAGDGGRR
ncbi:ATP/GTP-binding protein [Streptacidiphilus sp. ASG 303]|uniref:ATP/GTP-binding protein n=1 Tax=Streptacidiphilus sp. ASG 303 TaxID=2896847 RepID=UPI001E39C274|nr:ATP/GTP-binding protein [Streptacidiphilus sp. ASG 303]MCD0486297.1 ATP/GTP-binding protein [Streptacidiphilus sp. ASG 303]